LARGRSTVAGAGPPADPDTAMTLPPEHFRHLAHCPRCAAPAAAPHDVPFRCAACGFVLFFNAAAAVAAFIAREDGTVLFTRRARPPAAGLLGVPGGFVDFGETAEEALRREALEEVGLALGELQYLASFPNRYAYAGVTYHTLDLFFETRLPAGAQPRALDAVDGLCWRAPAAVAPHEIAFPSMRAAVARLARRRPA